MDDFDEPNDRSDCVCDAPDPEIDEPWVPVVCANCGGKL